MVGTNQPGFRVLRDYAEPGATRRMHSHDDATYHVVVLIVALHLEGGTRHMFTNTGSVTATIVEVSGKAPKPQ